MNRLVGPFLLRRRKTDAAIAAELPEKIVSDHLVELTPEQRALYTAVTRDTFGNIRASSGIQRARPHPAYAAGAPPGLQLSGPLPA